MTNFIDKSVVHVSFLGFFLGMMGVLFSTTLEAGHVIGGDITYTCLGEGSVPNTRNYEFRMVLLRDCNTQGNPNIANFFDNPAAIGIHRLNSNGVYEVYSVLNEFFDFEIDVNPENPNPCLLIPPSFCVRRAEYTWTVENLPIIDTEYMISYQRCCRNNTILNIPDPGSTGAAIFTTLSSFSMEECNSSPRFVDYPSSIICVNFPYLFDHSATDEDGDELRYRFCEIQSAGSNDNANFCGIIPDPTFCVPPFDDINFLAPLYSFDEPIVSDPIFTIDEMTGLITGTPSIQGQYVLGICVEEYRNGVLIGETKRDFQYNVAFCEPVVDALIVGATIVDSLLVFTSCGQSQIDLINSSIDEQFIQTYNWVIDFPNGNTFTSNQRDISLLLPEAGTYRGIMAVNEGLPCSDTAFLEIIVTDSIDSAFDVFRDSCLEGPITFADRSFSVGNTISEWLWDFGDGNTASGQVVMHQYDAPGNYAVSLRIVDTAGCDDIEVRNIRFFPIPEDLSASVNAEEGCSPFTVFFENTSSILDPAYDFAWRIGDSFFLQGINVEYTFLEAGNYDIQLSVVSPLGCEDRVTLPFDIEVSPAPDLDIEIMRDPCLPGEIEVKDSSSYPIEITSLLWDLGDGTTVPDVSQLLHAYKEPGIYTLRLNVTDILGCAYEYQEDIQYFPIPTEVRASMDTSSGCVPLDLILTNETELVDDRYQIIWTDNQGWVDTGLQVTVTIDEPGEYLYQASITSPSGCIDSFGFDKAVLALPQPQSIWDYKPYEPTKLDPTVQFINLSSDADRYEWWMDDLTKLRQQNPRFDFPRVDSFLVSLLAFNTLGCMDSSSLWIEVLPAVNMYIPNVFSPNQDGLNDSVRPFFSCPVDRFDFKVFDRWGSLVFHSQNQSVEWDGIIKGQEAPLGVYVWSVEYEINDRKGPQRRTGNVTLVR